MTVRMNKGLFIGGAVLVIGVAFALLVQEGLRELHEGQEDSARRALFVEVMGLLDSHYEQQHRYPSILGELVITNWPDGSSPATLSRFDYRSDGTSFSMVCSLPEQEPLSARGPK
jgi:hypothetical protein